MHMLRLFFCAFIKKRFRSCFLRFLMFLRGRGGKGRGRGRYTVHFISQGKKEQAIQIYSYCSMEMRAGKRASDGAISIISPASFLPSIFVLVFLPLLIIGTFSRSIGCMVVRNRFRAKSSRASQENV